MPSLTRKSLPVLDGSGNARTASGSGHLWRSMGELISGRDRAASAAEFPVGAAELGDGTSRRTFVQLLGASVALAGLSGCLKQPDEKILPYTRQPDEVIPGNELHFATATALGGLATGLLVASREGRPIKVEGNPQHPSSLGATGLLEQASLLQLYDPNRAKVVQQNGTPRAWRGFLGSMAESAKSLQGRQGEGLRFLLEPSSSPLIGSLRDRLQKTFPKARFHTWSALPQEAAFDAARLAFGAPLETRFDLSKAAVIACLDADLLSGLPGNIPHMRGYADRRVPRGEGEAGEKASGEMNRLYVVETTLSVTGMNADHRLRARPSEIGPFALALLGRIAARAPGLARFAGLAQKFPLQKDQARFADALAADLVRAGPAAVVAIGPRQPAAVQAVAHAINHALGSAAVSHVKPLLHDGDSGARTLLALTEDIRAGKVDTLVITARNPVHAAPADLNFGKALASVPTSVYHSLYVDETAERAGWVIPATHEMESWGDARAHDGTVTFVQPLVSPLFNGVAEAEVLASLLGEGDKSAYAQLRDFWEKAPEGRGSGSFADRWEKWLSDGFIAGTAAPAERPAPRLDAIATALAQVPAAAPVELASGLELNVVVDGKIYDGRFANNAWLQELPDPVTKLTWENAALMSPATAAALGLELGDAVDLGLRGPPVRAPVVILPGHADGAVTVSIGYGRTSATEEVAKGRGFDVAPLRHSQSPWFDRGLTLTKAGKPFPLAITQEHASMEGRALALSTTVEKLHRAPDQFEEHRGNLPTIQPITDYTQGHRWGMAIDLSRCTGCSACVVACQSENNIPVVGPENVAKSREMHWLRIDRYFSGDENNPEVITQPVACVHCEMAPCEYVCPVNATVHSDEGLNEMVYNRCVGTRYCSNNCPYKVRRFNFFSYTSNFTDTERMVFNPEVTVRSRGVMEKCTYCVQRIERVRITTRVENRDIRAGELQTACQQVCPASAISFGSLNDAEAQVTKMHKDERSYGLLNELGTRPRTAYLARVKNPNPELA